MITSRSFIVDTLTSRAFIAGVIVFFLLAPLFAALGFDVGTHEVVIALVAAVLAWFSVRDHHRMLGFFVFAYTTLTVFFGVALLFATTSSP